MDAVGVWRANGRAGWGVVGGWLSRFCLSYSNQPISAKHNMLASCVRVANSQNKESLALIVYRVSCS